MSDGDMSPAEILELMESTARELNHLRDEQERADGELRSMREQMEAGERWQTHQGIVKESGERIDELEAGLRSLAVEYFKQTGVKTPHEAAGVRVIEHMEYDREAAASWAWENLREAFKFDPKTFEKYAKGVRDVKPLPFVRFEKRPQPVISRKPPRDVSGERGPDEQG